MSSEDTFATRRSDDRMTALEARAQWAALASEAGLLGDFSFEALLDRLEHLVLER